MEYQVSPAGARLYKHHLTIDTLSGEVVIRESTLNCYLRFLKSWEIAASVSVENRTATLASLWLGNATFRSHMTEALSAVGIDDPGILTVGQLNDLLLVSKIGEDTRPLLFQLNADSPDPKRLGNLQEATTQTVKIPQKLTWLQRFKSHFAKSPVLS